MVLLSWLEFAVIISLIFAEDATLYERGVSSMSVPMPLASFGLDSEVRCAIICSRDVLCEMYSYDAKQLSCSHFPAPEWSYDVVTFDTKGSVSFRAPLWKIAFKVSAGTGDVAYDVWSQAGAHAGGFHCSRNTATPCTSTYKDVIVDEWRDIKEVRLEFYTNGTLGAYAVFDARGTDRWSWLSGHRLIVSSWNDVQDYATDDTMIASMEGIDHGWSGRYRFMMNSNIDDIGADTGGWFHVLDPSIPVPIDDCNSPHSTAKRPLLRYSKKAGKSVIITSKNGVYLSRPPGGRHTLTLAEVTPQCAVVGSSVASEQDLVDLQVAGERGCCNCGWTAEGSVRLIKMFPTPRSGCSNYNCGYRSTSDAWCKVDTGNIGHADTMVIFVR